MNGNDWPAYLLVHLITSLQQSIIISKVIVWIKIKFVNKDRGVIMQEVLNKILEFRKERNWEQFHTPENLAKSIAIEAAELLECFQWDAKNAKSEKVKEELADVILYCLYLAHHYNFDVKEILVEKIKRNAQKYPVEKAKGISTKYNKL